MKSNKCATCDQEFPSRNKLFQHLKDSGHGVTGEDKKDDAATGVDAKADGSIKTEDGKSASKGNEAFYEYYLRQNICGTGECGEKKWKDAYKLLCTPLPISYRIQESSWMGSDFCADFLDAIENNLFDKNCEGGENNGHGMDETNVTNNNNDDNEKKNIYHWSLASDDIPVQTNTTPSDTKPCSSNPLPKIRMAIIPHHHNRENNNGQSKRNSSSKDDKNNTYLSIIHALQELGAIHRQELVSAIPPLVLWSASSLSNKEKEGEHKEGGGGVIIADMCAAPGSKSLQLLDLLHMGPKNVNDADAGAVAKDTLQIPAGLLVVNDSDRNRIMTLCQRLRRVPKAPVLAINVDARYFPGMRRKCKWNGGGGVSKREVLNSVDIASNQNNETTKANSKEKMTKAEDDSFCNSHKKPFFMEKMGYKQKYDKVRVQIHYQMCALIVSAGVTYFFIQFISIGSNLK